MFLRKKEKKKKREKKLSNVLIMISVLIILFVVLPWLVNGMTDGLTQKYDIYAANDRKVTNYVMSLFNETKGDESLDDLLTDEARLNEMRENLKYADQYLGVRYIFIARVEGNDLVFVEELVRDKTSKYRDRIPLVDGQIPNARRDHMPWDILEVIPEKANGNGINFMKFWTLTGSVRPIENDQNEAEGYLVCCFDERSIIYSQLVSTIKVVFYTFLQMVLVTAILVLLTIFFIARPIRKMALAANTLMTKDQKFESPQERFGRHLFSSIKVRSNTEIGLLHNNLIEMEEALYSFVTDLVSMTKAKEKISAELQVGTQIQASLLEHYFPDRKEFDLYVSMTPAKEVAGDFYDFFLPDEDHLCLVIADVSDKGVPAALFMVSALTSIRSRGMLGGTPSEIISDVNDQLCSKNGMEMFVTIWMAIIDLRTGEGMAVNAGHEGPALKRAGGQFEVLKYPHDMVAASFPGMAFHDRPFKLAPGDTIFVYTDGVTEATAADEELFGVSRMVEALNLVPEDDPKDLIDTVRSSIDAFVGKADQFDDITMLAMRYNG